MSNLNDIFFTPAANQELTYDQVLEDVQRYFAENHASTIAEAGEGNAERATSLLKELMEHYIVKRKYALDGLSTKELCSKLYEDMAGYSFLKKWIYKPGVEEVNINAYNDIEVIESSGRSIKIPDKFSSPQHAIDVIRRMLNACGMVIDDTMPSIVGFLDKNMLNWRILRWDDIAQEYEKLATASGYCTERSWEDCTNRLLTRGLLVSGSGETEYDALYDLLGSLSIIPTSGPFFLRLASFVKLTLLAHVPVSAARKLFQKDKRTKYEALVMRLAGQALLSTAEIIKCIDKNISRLPNECALLDSLYGDETTTSDNIASMVKISQSSKPVTLAVANLYLRQQIIFERV